MPNIGGNKEELNCEKEFKKSFGVKENPKGHDIMIKYIFYMIINSIKNQLVRLMIYQIWLNVKLTKFLVFIRKKKDYLIYSYIKIYKL